jgi:hypothetical protein
VVKALESKEDYEKLSPLLNEADKALDGGLWVRSVFQVMPSYEFK